jgi:hypothetical protein
MAPARVDNTVHKYVPKALKTGNVTILGVSNSARTLHNLCGVCASGLHSDTQVVSRSRTCVIRRSPMNRLVPRSVHRVRTRGILYYGGVVLHSDTPKLCLDLGLCDKALPYESPCTTIRASCATARSSCVRSFMRACILFAAVVCDATRVALCDA